MHLRFCLLVLVVTKLAFAQTPEPSPAQKLDKNMQLLEMQVELAQNMFSISKTPENKLKLAGVYEDYLSTRCRGYMATRISNNPKCAEFAQEIVNLDPGNPIGICAFNGVNSKSCSEAYQRVQIKEFSTYDLEKAEPNKQRLKQTQEKIAGIIEQIQRLQAEHQRLKSSQSLEALVAKYESLIPLTCQKSFYRSEGTDDIRRVRYLSSQCLQVVKEALELDPNNPAALCHMYGGISPRCLKASRARKTRNQNQENSTSSIDESGFKGL